MKPFLYERLYAALLLELSSGFYAEEARFLSLRQVCARFGASKPTANQVLAMLLEGGLLVTKVRSGTFVARGARERAMLLLEKRPLSTIPAPRSWAAQRGRLMQKIGTIPRRRVAIIYHSSNQSFNGSDLVEREVPVSIRCSQGCMKAARERGVEVSFAMHDGSEERHRRITQWLAEAPAGGVLIIQRSASFRQFHELVDPLLAAGLPVVNAFGDLRGADIINVDFNNVAGSFHATMEMINCGCRRVTVITAETAALHSTVLRIEGARLAARQCGVEFRTLCATIENGTVRLPPFLETKWMPEGILALTYDFGLAVLSRASETAARPGRDFTCFAFSSVAETPSGERLNILKMDFDAIGEAAMHALLDEMEGAEVHRSILIALPVCRASEG